MSTNPQFPADLVTFPEEMPNEKLHFLCSDTWRKINLEKTEFTYHRPQSDIHSRLDKIYASHNLHIIKSQILPLQCSDHEALLTEFTMRARARDPGYWKLNTSILEHGTLKKATKD